jgi:hypothetical protein
MHTSVQVQAVTHHALYAINAVASRLQNAVQVIVTPQITEPP